MFWLLEIKYQICVSHIEGKDMIKDCPGYLKVHYLLLDQNSASRTYGVPPVVMTLKIMLSALP